MNYKLEINEINLCKLKLDFIVSNEEVHVQTSKVYFGLQQRAKIGGFRPGKVPIEIVKQKFTSTAREMVIENILKQTLSLAIKEKELKPITIPVVEKMDFDFDKPFFFTVTMETYPKIVLKQYKNLKIKKTKNEITEKDIENELKILQKNYTKLEDSKSDIPNKNDCVYVSYKVFYNNMFIKELSTDNELIDLEEKYSINEIVENLLTMRKNQEKELNIKLPENLLNKNFRGKEVLLKLKLLSIKSKIIPVVDDEFAKDLDSTNLKHLREKIKESLKQHNQQQAQTEYKEKIYEKLIEINKVDVPESFVEKQKKYIIYLARQQKKNQGFPEEIVNNQITAMSETYKKEAEKDVKIFFIMSEIATKENIIVSDNEIKEYKEKMIKLNPNKETKFEQYFEENLDKIKIDLLFNKIYKLLWEGRGPDE